MRRRPYQTVALLEALLLIVMVIAWSFRGRNHASSAAQPTTRKSNAAAPAPREVAYWWDPMLGPSSISDHPGKSAMGMDLVPKYEDDVASGPSVTIDPAVVQNMGVTTALVQRGPLTVTIRTVGMLQVPEPALHDITLKINGYVNRLYANTEGISVKKGQALLDLYSPDLQVAEQELIGAEQNLKGLDGGAGQNVRADAQNLVDSARQKLRLWDIAEADIASIATAGQAPRTVPIRSPADGIVVDKMVVEGSAIQAGMKVMRVQDQSRLWLDLAVYEEQIPVVKIGQEVRATVDGAPGKSFVGKVIFVDPRVDPMARTETVRVVLDNAGGGLSPGMYATAEIVTQAVADAVLAPKEAVIDTGTEQIAFVLDPASAGHFEPRKVRMGIAGDEDKVQIVDGLAPGDQVVTSGQFLMDVESRTTEAIEKLRKGSSGEATSAAPADDASMLIVAHCSMRNADWIQTGSVMANPYLGPSMSSCGEVKQHLQMPADGAPLSGILQAYLKVGADLNHGVFNASAAAELRSQTIAAGKEASDDLRAAAAHLAGAKDLDGARAAFQEITAGLAAKLETAAAK